MTIFDSNVPQSNASTEGVFDDRPRMRVDRRVDSVEIFIVSYQYTTEATGVLKMQDSVVY
jgi:hypothetical protein